MDFFKLLQQAVGGANHLISNAMHGGQQAAGAVGHAVQQAAPAPVRAVFGNGGGGSFGGAQPIHPDVQNYLHALLGGGGVAGLSYARPKPLSQMQQRQMYPMKQLAQPIQQLQDPTFLDLKNDMAPYANGQTPALGNVQNPFSLRRNNAPGGHYMSQYDNASINDGAGINYPGTLHNEQEQPYLDSVNQYMNPTGMYKRPGGSQLRRGY